MSELAKKLLSGDKKALAKAMTLVSSHLDKDKKEAKKLVEEVLKNSKSSYRIGVSGIGGVGKSSFIEALGSYLLEQDKDLKLGVLTIDPASPEHGGSVLADSVRMPRLAGEERVFIRSLSNKAFSGGLSPEAWELVSLLEGSGCDLVFIESVGTGQSDDKISLLADTSILLQMPASGDGMQAMKKGSLETADILVIHKNDGLLKKEAEKAALLYRQTQSLLESIHKRNTPPVILVSSNERTGLKDLWEAVSLQKKQKENSKELETERSQKSVKAFEEAMVLLLKEELLRNKKFLKLREEIEEDLKKRKVTPLLGARELLNKIP